LSSILGLVRSSVLVSSLESSLEPGREFLKVGPFLKPYRSRAKIESLSNLFWKLSDVLSLGATAFLSVLLSCFLAESNTECLSFTSLDCFEVTLVPQPPTSDLLPLAHITFYLRGDCCCGDCASLFSGEFSADLRLNIS